MLVACTIGMGESQPDADSKNDQKNGTIIFTGGAGFYAMVRFYAPTGPVLKLHYQLPDMVPVISNQ